LGYKNINTIHNPIGIEEVASLSRENISFDFDYILSVGRMNDNIKQFDKLILSYAESSCLLKI
jgi:N-acetylgalactosamine-N,N'-diacetylbacillosaminyl-diphospho-undecaprenol 4-alpha-N-acetylgalactosaminyltransferase